MDTDNIFETPVETGTPTETTTETQVETPAAPVEETTQQTEQQLTEPPQFPSLKVKFNHEEREIPYEEAVQLTQKGLNYDKLQEKLNLLQTDPRLSFVEQQAQKYNLTPEQYIEAVKQQEEQEALNELIQKNIPEEYAKEIMANRQMRTQWEEQQKASETQRKQEADALEFAEQYPDVKIEEIPQSVWQDVIEKGKSLVDAYAKHDAAQLRNRIKVLEQNLANQQKAPVGSVTNHGGGEPNSDPFLQGFSSI